MVGLSVLLACVAASGFALWKGRLLRETHLAPQRRGLRVHPLILFGAFAAGGLILAGMAMGLIRVLDHTGAPRDAVNVLSTALARLVVFAALGPIYLRCTRTLEGRRPAWRSIGLGVWGLLLTGPWVYLALAASSELLERLGHKVLSQHETLQVLSQANNLLAGLIFIDAGWITPAVEELLFRGCFQASLAEALAVAFPRRTGLMRVLAIAIVSFCFAAAHPGYERLAIFVLALGLGWVTERTGRILPAIVMHIGFNLANLAVVFINAHR